MIAAVAVIVLSSCASLQTNEQKDQPKGATAQADNAGPPSGQTGTKGQPQTAKPEDRAEQEPLPWFGPHNVAEWATVLVTFGAILVAYWTLDRLKEQTTVASGAADAAKINAEAVMLAERAFVAMSHTGGLHPVRGIPNYGEWHTQIEISNCGNTPATVLYGSMKVIEARTPFTPSIADGRLLPGGFLVRGKHYFVTFRWVPIPEEIQQFQNGQLVLVGYVVYQDSFGMLHRAGYGRTLNPWVQAPDNNLTWDHDVARFNYDIEIDEQGNPKSKDGQKARS